MQWRVDEIRDQWGMRGECLVAEPLAPLTTWRVGGSADLLVRPVDLEDVHALFNFLRHNRLPWVVLGGGSNVLIADSGVRGVVIQLTDMNYIIPCGECQLRVGAGCSINHLVAETVRQGYAGFESLAGIPGTVGAAVAGNAGALGQQVGDCVHSGLVAENAAVERWLHEEFAFGYRSSAITTEYVVLEVTMKCQRGQPEQLRQRVKLARQHRWQAQPVVGANAGSVFKNPPRQSAWKLIAESGLQGKSVGDAQVSKQHANFIVNCGKASAMDIVALVSKVQQVVAEKTGFKLEPEIKFIGDFGEAAVQVALMQVNGRV
ncbi:MAG: UDP-N-acetylenolpyruvoylglucosamine reductase [Desulfobacteraceae bacterium 4572_35.1]|nr:MAG: UDP-N-acetylenolpyruvoylglucosamine reductase [Desulfobacteraceae bacterium 4572_35.1]